MFSETDVIIIGAGAAGLSAAKELQRLGRTTTVIEGAPRIGGRAHSAEIALWCECYDCSSPEG